MYKNTSYAYVYYLMSWRRLLLILQGPAQITDGVLMVVGATMVKIKKSSLYLKRNSMTNRNLQVGPEVLQYRKILGCGTPQSPYRYRQLFCRCLTAM